MRSVTEALYRPERLLLQLTTKSRRRPTRPRHNSPPQRRKRKSQEIRETTLSFLPTPTAPLCRHWLSQAKSWPRDKRLSNWLTPAPAKLQSSFRRRSDQFSPRKHMPYFMEKLRPFLSAHTTSPNLLTPDPPPSHPHH